MKLQLKWPFFSSEDRQAKYPPNPHLKMLPGNSGQRSGFFSTGEGNFFVGWDTSTHGIDFYLRSDLTKVRARSREVVRKTPLGKRLVDLMKTNVIGPKGVTIQAQSEMFKAGKVILDKRVNDELEKLFKRWACTPGLCDKRGISTFLSMQHAAISNCTQDGEFVFRKHYGKSAGEFGFQLEAIDPELLDTQKNEELSDGRQIRLGVEYDENDRILRYWFRERNFNGDYHSGKSYSIEARFIIHGFIPEWPNQSRGVPWTHAGLEEAKHLSKFKEGLIVRARASANVAIALTSKEADTYEGDEQDEADESLTYDPIVAGTIKDFGRREITSIDPDYPTAAVETFIKTQMRDLSAAWGVSYQSLSNDLEGTSFSSGRVGVQEERENYKTKQEWFINTFIRPVYEEWVLTGYMNGSINLNGVRLAKNVNEYLPAEYMPRRWQWIDPAKDGNSNKLAIDYRLKSRSQIMSENGDDFETVITQIASEKQRMEELGLTEEDVDGNADSEKPDEEDQDDKEEVKN